MANLSDLRTAVRHLVNSEDASNTQFSNAELLTYLNEAARDLSAYMEWGVTQSTATSVLNQATYTLPTRILYIIDAYFDESKLTIVDISDLPGIAIGWPDDAAGEPARMYRSSWTAIGLNPKPSADYASKTIRLYYVKITDDMVNDADSPDFNLVLQDILQYYAAAKCHWKAGNDDAGDRRMAFYEKKKNELKARSRKYAEDLLRWRYEQ